MKNVIPLMLIIASVFLSCKSPQIYKSNDFKESKQSVKTVAILPFSVTIDSKRLPKGLTMEMLKESEQKTGYDMQNNAYTWFLNRNKEYTVEFQDIDKTNIILRELNITYDNMLIKEKGELCKLLKVDVVISGKCVLSKPMSEGGAIAYAFFVGPGAKTNQADITLNIHNTESNLLWKFDYSKGKGSGSSPEKVINLVLKKSSKSFPYKR